MSYNTSRAQSLALFVTKKLIAKAVHINERLFIKYVLQLLFGLVAIAWAAIVNLGHKAFGELVDSNHHQSGLGVLIVSSGLESSNLLSICQQVSLGKGILLLLEYIISHAKILKGAWDKVMFIWTKRWDIEWKQWGMVGNSLQAKLVQNYFTLESALGIGWEETRVRNRLLGRQTNISGAIDSSIRAVEKCRECDRMALSLGFFHSWIPHH